MVFLSLSWKFTRVGLELDDSITDSMDSFALTNLIIENYRSGAGWGGEIGSLEECSVKFPIKSRKDVVIW